MNEKNDRKSEVKAIIATGNIHNQEELMSYLDVRGYSITQATLSRLLKDLGVAKVYDKLYGYCYRLPSYENSFDKAYREVRPADGILSVEFCGNIVVIKTIPGFANVVASVIDRNLDTEIAGTIAGDDTIFATIRTRFTVQQVVSSLEHYLPSIELKIKR